jgi:hypothetical protein
MEDGDPMSRLASVALSALLLGAAAPASAEESSEARKKEAAEAFDAGVDALKSNDYAAAAAHFEAADTAVPSPQALRQAIKARGQARQAGLAATLASEALDRYPGDEATAKVAHDTLEHLEPGLHKLRVACGSPCVPAVGGKAVHGEAARTWVVYLDPGRVAVSAALADGTSADPASVDAEAGGSGEVKLGMGGKETAAGGPVDPGETPPADADEPKPSKWKRLPRGVFFGGAAVTVGLAATTIWSGIDTQNNPGAAAVAKECAGKGPSCPVFQQGLGKQNRTNALIGVTAGVAALTAVTGLFFTNWQGGKAKPKDKSEAVLPFATVTSGGAVLGATGGF